VDESEWVRFIKTGWPKEVAVGRLGRQLTKVLRADTDRVVLRHDYALKCVHKHGLDHFHFPMMGIAMEFGRALYDEGRPNHLLFLHRDDIVFQRWFKLVLKVTGPGELYVTTFHRVEAVDVNRLVKGKLILRDDPGN
jgi:hypothetical protein